MNCFMSQNFIQYVRRQSEFVNNINYITKSADILTNKDTRQIAMNTYCFKTSKE